MELGGNRLLRKVEIGAVNELKYVTPNTIKNVGLKREDVLLKYCEKYNSKIIKQSNKISIETINNEFSRIAQHLDSTEQKQLLRLIDNNEMTLYTKSNIFSQSTEAKASLNIWLASDKNFSKNLTQFKELLKMEREGKIQGKYIPEILRLTQVAEDPKILNEFMIALKNGKIREKNIEIAIKRCLDCEPLDFLRVLPKGNQVDEIASNKLLKEIDNIANTFKNGKGIDQLKEYGGIKLQYSRDEFKSNINKLIEHLSPAEQESILMKFGLKNEGLNRISDLPVFMHDTKALNATEKAINNEIRNFLYNNEILLPKEFSDYKNSLEIICDAIPEFKFTIGLKQHQGQDFQLAEHLLKVFQENTRNPLYKTLNETDKKVLGVASILHDIRKIEKTKDFGHALPSSLTVDAIVNRMNLSTAEKNRIINMVENHHWLEKIQSGTNIDKHMTEDIADIFKSGNDFTIAKIFAESDLRSVNSTFYKLYGDKINSPATKAIEKEILNIQKNGRMIYTSDVSLSNILKAGGQKVTLGKNTETTENIIINANDLNLDKTAFGYHSSSIENLKNAYAAGRHGVSGVFSLSIEKNGAIPTYNKEMPEFLITRRLNMDNICFIRPQTSNTKYLKDYTFMSIKSRSDVHFANGLKQKYAKLTNKTLSDEQYAELFREIPRDNIENIHKNQKIIKILGGEKEAIAFENAVIAQNNAYISKEVFSEAVVGDLEWGAIGTKRLNLSEIPFELRKFAQENNIPFVMFN